MLFAYQYARGALGSEICSYMFLAYQEFTAGNTSQFCSFHFEILQIYLIHKCLYGLAVIVLLVVHQNRVVIDAQFFQRLICLLFGQTHTIQL